MVGLTGGIGSGKSSFGRMLAERGALVVDADLLARRAVEPDGPSYRPVVERFGPGVVGSDGRIDRSALADLVFDDRAALDDLNAIVHPAVNAAISRTLADHEGTDRVVVLEVPLWVEKGYGGVAGVIVVDCPEDLALARLVAERGMDPADVHRRLAVQASREDRIAQADFVIRNDGSLDDLRRQADETWAWIQTLTRPAAG